MSIVRVDGIAFSPPEAPGPIGSAGGATASASASGGVSFDSILTDAISQANTADAVASQRSAALASGAIDDIHGTMIAVKEADISMKLVGTVRNKILEAFQELWKTSV